MEVLVEHAGGVDDWHKRYRKKLRGKRHRNMPAWVKKYFGELDNLEKQYNNIKSSLGM